ncbi:angiopoietin-related protein 1-like [Stylophora pistillata]|uniref:angiopoietin-related protein 1-like n=1 Tax=Stylophora pistillata TaxID=50429 RepID=UPI000C04A9B4|nr:angiopoietin-related protein 1-like [Stylophora pistillata]
MSVSQNSSLLLSVVLLFMIQLLPSTRAAPIICKNNCRKSEKFKNCAELYKSGQTISGIYTIDLGDGKGAFDVYCDQTTDGGGWTVIQKRVDDTVDFNRTWKDYENGFGDFLIRDFWLGLDKIQRLTQNKTENQLRMDLGVTANKTVYAQYEWFGIENETDHYRLRIGSFSSATLTRDSLAHHNGMSFSTWNRSSTDHNCTSFGGGWWYLKDKCSISSNLNGIYPSQGRTVDRIHRIHWGELRENAENQAPTRTEMKIRRKDFHRG